MHVTSLLLRQQGCLAVRRHPRCGRYSTLAGPWRVRWEFASLALDPLLSMGCVWFVTLQKIGCKVYTTNMLTFKTSKINYKIEISSQNFLPYHVAQTETTRPQRLCRLDAGRWPFTQNSFWIFLEWFELWINAQVGKFWKSSFWIVS